MTRKKRCYVPKVKGCYECSQRRIDCDNTHPSCRKCQSKGIACSGFGVKYRFRDGLAQHGGRKTSSAGTGIRWTSEGGTLQSRARAKTGGEVEDDTSVRRSFEDCLPRKTTDVGLSADWGDFDFEYSPSDGSQSWAGCGIPPHQSTCDYGIPYGYEQADSLCITPSTWDASFGVLEGVSWEDPNLLSSSNDVFEIVDEHASVLDDHDSSTTGTSDDGSLIREEEDNLMYLSPSPDTTYTVAHSPPRELNLGEPSQLFMLRHFSEKIAPEMVVIDGQYNGWRHLILPLALTDDLVMSAVLAASAFHVSGRGGGGGNPRALYAGALRKLQQRRELTGCDAGTKQMVILAIIVLLVVVMINGCSDFPVMFRMLQSAVDAIGGEDGLRQGGEVGEFSLRQIRKMRVYAAPLLSPDDGLHTLTAHAEESFDCLTYHTRLYHEHAPAFKTIASLRRQAFNIYLQRVLCSSSSSRATSTSTDEEDEEDDAMEDYHSQNVDTFLRTLKKFPRGAPGEHILVWSCFMAASESRDAEQQDYLRRFLARQYARNGFENITKALQLLRRIWARGSNRDWPALLPEPQVFIM